MGIALITLSAVQTPLRSLRRFFASSAQCHRPPLQGEVRDAMDTRTCAEGIVSLPGDPQGTAQPSLWTERPGQRPLRGNWPFTAKPPTKPLEAPAKPPANSSLSTHTLLCAHRADVKRQSMMASLGTGTHTGRATRVLRRTSDAGTGRLVIAGRMADVCAELDRMAALEGLQA